MTLQDWLDFIHLEIGKKQGSQGKHSSTSQPMPALQAEYITILVPLSFG
jgi:hypothetical protein